MTITLNQAEMAKIIVDHLSRTGKFAEMGVDKFTATTVFWCDLDRKPGEKFWLEVTPKRVE